jgi:tetratricopeptide (TPR) repeat protein
MIREVDPPRPSTRLSSLGPDAGEIARKRQTQIDDLTWQLRRELEWIPLKAMRKDRADRYRTAQELGDDVVNYLHGRALLAGPESVRYRFRKLVRRNIGAVAAVAAVAAAVLLGAAGAGWQAVRATLAQRLADTRLLEIKAESAKQAAVYQFLNDLFRAAGQQRSGGGTANRTVDFVQALKDAAEKIESGSLQHQPEVEAAVRTTIGQTYNALGDRAAAAHHLRVALALTRQRYGGDHPEVAASLEKLGFALWNQRRDQDAESLFREALEMQRRLHRGAHEAVWASLGVLAGFLDGQGRYAEAESLYRAQLEIRKALPDSEPAAISDGSLALPLLLRLQHKRNEAEELLRNELSLRKKKLGSEHPAVLRCMESLIAVLDDQGKMAEAEQYYRESLLLERKLPRFEPRDGNLYAVTNGVGDTRRLREFALWLIRRGKTSEGESILRESIEGMRRRGKDDELALALNNLGYQLREMGKLSDAEPLLREGVAIAERLGNTHLLVASLDEIGSLLKQQGKLSEAEVCFRDALTREWTAYGSSTVAILSNLATLLLEQGRQAEAEDLYHAELERLRARGGTTEPHLALFLTSYSHFLRDLGKTDLAVPLLQEALAIRQDWLGREDPDVAATMHELAFMLYNEGDFAQAESLHRQALEMRRKFYGPEHSQVAASLESLAAVLVDQGRVIEAEPLLRTALEMRRRLSGSELEMAGGLIGLGRLLIVERKPAEAEPLLRQALSIREKTLPAEHWQRANAASLLGEALADQQKFAEAEPLLLAGHKGMKDKPKVPETRRRESIARLVKLYEVWEEPAQAAAWRATLAEFDREHPPTTKPSTQHRRADTSAHRH